MRLNGLRLISGVQTPTEDSRKALSFILARRTGIILLIAALAMQIFVPAAGAGDRTTRVITLLSSGTYTAATAYSSSFDVSAYAEGQIFIDVTAEAGASTLDVTIQSSPDDSTWFTHTTVGQISATGQTLQVLTNLGKYIRVKYVVGGTNFTFSVKGVFKN